MLFAQNGVASPSAFADAMADKCQRRLNIKCEKETFDSVLLWIDAHLKELEQSKYTAEEVSGLRV